jgi:LPS export ABC transporter protein LptC
MNWRWISLTSLLAALVLGYGSFVRRESPDVAIGAAPEQPGYYLKDAVITQTQADGSIGMRLATNRIEQQTKDDSIVMTPVRVDYFQVPGREWRLSAQRGFVPANSRVVQLNGDVAVRAADDPANLFLAVDALAIDTVRNVAYSMSSPVELQSGPHHLTVSGFEADLKEEKIHAKTAQGRFTPP